MITMWIMASQIGMECKWLLLLPIEHSAYTGLVADAYTRECGNRSSDLCTFEAVITIMFYLIVGAAYLSQTYLWIYPIVSLVFVKLFLRYAEFVCIYGLYFRHKCLLALASLIPGVSLICALKIRRG